MVNLSISPTARCLPGDSEQENIIEIEDGQDGKYTVENKLDLIRNYAHLSVRTLVIKNGKGEQIHQMRHYSFKSWNGLEGPLEGSYSSLKMLLESFADHLIRSYWNLVEGK